MTQPLHRWALLVATQHGEPAAVHMGVDERTREMRQLLTRAKAVATPERTVALIAARFEPDWRTMAADLPPYNVLVNSSSASVLNGIEQALKAVRAREADCSVVLIPANHCAAVETSWVVGAREALALAAVYRDTVYLLHDKSQDPSPFDAMNDLCSSTVVVGSTDCLLELCRGTRPTRLIELTTKDHVEPDCAASAVSGKKVMEPIRIVRVQSVEEYAWLQRGQYDKASAGVDLHA